MLLNTLLVIMTIINQKTYVPTRDLYIDKELQMNERIEQERFPQLPL